MEQGFDVTCYEASDRIGGNWVYENKNGMSACYRDLHINTSRQKMAYADYPMPESLPDFPSHFQIAQYFDSLGLKPGDTVAQLAVNRFEVFAIIAPGIGTVTATRVCGSAEARRTRWVPRLGRSRTRSSRVVR